MNKRNQLSVPTDERDFIDSIKRIVDKARLQSYAAINAVMVETYWNIGRRIVEQEQCGKTERIMARNC